MGHFKDGNTNLSQYIQQLATRSAHSESKLCQLRWSWLLKPSHASATALANYLRTQKTAPTEMATEYENTVAWISLFDATFINRRFNHAKRSIFDKIENAEVRFENLLVRYLFADRNGDAAQSRSLLEGLRNSFFPDSSEKSESRAEALLESIELLKLPHKDKPRLKTTVYFGHWEIHANGKKFISKPLCVFIELLRTNISISFEELLAAAFDIPKYTSVYHYQKIQNLISRLRILSPDFLINTRQGRIYSSIDWSQVSVISRSRHQESLKQSDISDVFLDSEEEKVAIEKCTMRISISKLKATLSSNFSRADFERVTGIPRSTASRFLKNWMDQEILARTGAGKATIYNFK
jgi:hypothetical protein